MKAILSLEINKKHGRGWSVHKVVTWSKMDTPNHTYVGASTLASALWQNLDQRGVDFSVDTITVNEKPMSPKEAYQLILKALRGGSLDYALPRYQKTLGLA